MTGLTYGSLFAGVGGFDMGMDHAGFTCLWQAEWDKHCQSILRRHWPDADLYGDVQQINGADLKPVDVITFGSPCQDLSVAGKRAGLDGNKSSMFFEATRIIKEMRDATSSRPTGPFPRIAVWENVPGALSSNRGADFGVVLDTLADIGAVAIEWHVLDARWFGIPQRRRRVFVIAVFDSSIVGRGESPILPVVPRRDWNPPTRRVSWEASTGTLVDSTSTGSDTEHSEVRGSEPVNFDELNFTGGSEIHQSLRAGTRQSTWVAQPIAFSHTQGLDPQASVDVFPTLRREGSGQAVMTEYITRRLSPLECERLMGWPDDHTRWRVDGTEQPDTQRYKQCGNGVATPVATWIARHLHQTLTKPQPQD